MNLSRQRKHWENGSVMMEMTPEFELVSQGGDKLISFDVKGAVQEFLPTIGYGGLIPVSLRRAILQLHRDAVWVVTVWLTVHEVDEASEEAYERKDGVQSVAVRRRFTSDTVEPRNSSGGRDLCEGAGKGMMGGVHEDRAFGGASTTSTPKYLVDMREMQVYVVDRRVDRVKGLVKKLMVLAQRNRQLVPLKLLHHLCSVCVSLTLDLRWHAF